MRIATIPVCLCLTGLLALSPRTAPAEEARSHATLEQLRAAEAPEPIPNKAFLPVGEHAPAHAPFAGKLTLQPMVMRVEPALDPREVLGRDAQMFPGVMLEFFTHEGDLVPVSQGVITPDAAASGDSFWQIIVQPGRVWSEPGDDGWSRASFPFALMNRLENDTHNGVATFLYKGDKVTDLRFQIMQQTAPFYVAAHFDAWGTIEASYEPAAPGSHEEAQAAYKAELADRIPMKPWRALPVEVREKLEGFDGGADPQYVVMHALVRDGALYFQPSQTPYGPYPYPERMRFGVWSMTKSVGPGLGMLRLAQKYGAWVFGLELLDYLPIDPPHDGWEGVTFGDALDMATGLGGGTVDAHPNDMFVDYTWLDDYVDWYEARTTKDKIAALELVDDYPWGPGLVARYRDRDMFALGVAMNNFLESVEGEDADIWRMIAREVFAPMGIHHAPMNRTYPSDDDLGQPIMAWGWYPNLGDLAKVAQLLHERGRHDGQQILHPELTKALFSVEGTLTKGPANRLKYGVGRYKMAFHYAPFPVDGETMWLPYLSGYVGNRVVPLPNGMTVIRISNAWPAPDEVVAAVEDPTSMIEAAYRLEPFGE